MTSSPTHLFVRNIADVDKVVVHAKLRPEDLLPVSQVLQYPAADDHHNFTPAASVRLMEVDSALADGLEAGQTLIFKGDGDEDVVLCTEDKTYEMKEAETSNSLMLVDQVRWPDQIKKDEEERSLAQSYNLGVFYKYFELKPSQPHLGKVGAMLREHPFSGRSAESGAGLTFDALLDRAPCSEAELRAELSSTEAVLHEGRWYWLESDYHMKVLSLIANLVEENAPEWSLDRVRLQPTLEALEELEPRPVVEQIFRRFHEPIEDDDGDADDWFRTQRDRVSRFYGDYLLQSGSAFDLQEFLTMWQQAVPEGVSTDVAHLRGLALTDTTKTPHTIRHFPECDLPQKIQERLEMLFNVREKWTVEDIEPFIEKLTTPKLNVRALLTKFARGSQVKGVKHFSSKHRK